MADTLVTVTNVTDFLGITGTDQATTQATLIGNLITQAYEEFLLLTGRSANKITMTSMLLQDGVNCEIQGANLWLYGKYQDIISISALSEEGIALHPSIAYGDNLDYIINASEGCLIRLNNAWSRLPNALVITGYAGLGTVSNADFLIREDIKKIIIEMVAASSGLWKETIISPSGQLDVTRQGLPKDTKDKIARLKIKV